MGTFRSEGHFRSDASASKSIRTSIPATLYDGVALTTFAFTVSDVMVRSETDVSLVAAVSEPSISLANPISL
jgi:hypothetical protein